MLNPIHGVYLPVIDFVLTLPTARKDGTVFKLADIHSVTMMRDAGLGPIVIKEFTGPFHDATVPFSDTSPVSGNDIYSFFVTDTAGTKSDASKPVTVSVEGNRASAPKAGTMTAVERADHLAEPTEKPELGTKWAPKTEPKILLESHAR